MKVSQKSLPSRKQTERQQKGMCRVVDVDTRHMHMRDNYSTYFRFAGFICLVHDKINISVCVLHHPTELLTQKSLLAIESKCNK